jgi:hypothetical protein
MACSVSCRHTFSPIRDYRASKAYRQNLKIVFSNNDTVDVNQLIIASGLLTKTGIDKRIPLNEKNIIDAMSTHFGNTDDITLAVKDSIEVMTVDKFAFNDPWNRKISFDKFNLIDERKCQLVPYVEYSVRTRIETEGGGGLESITYTGNRIHNTRQGVVLMMFCEGKQVFSSGHYITDQFKDHKDSLTVYDFSLQRLDSLMGLCLEDLEKEIEANKDRLK